MLPEVKNDCCSRQAEQPQVPGRLIQLEPLPMFQPETGGDVACCGAPPGPPSRAEERPGYRLWPFVEDFMDTPAGPVPRVKTVLDRPDFRGAVGARIGLSRDEYKVAPGLYAVGKPDSESPVLVTANYKLTFDALRSELGGLDAWLLILDTRGINVWCAAGKKLLSTEELAYRIKQTRLGEVVGHRRLILPQLSATGVSSHRLKKASGFEAVWGPVQAGDLKKFIANGNKADPAMRRVTFTLSERAVLVPVEVFMAKKYLLYAVFAAFVLSGLGPGFFSFSAAWNRGLAVMAALLTGLLTGAVVMPLLLPWLPSRIFAVKGGVTGLAGGLLAVAALWPRTGGWLGGLSLTLLIVAVSSYFAMNFTGSTPYTSPSGVEKEMRRFIPWQAGMLLAGTILWIVSAFTG